MELTYLYTKLQITLSKLAIVALLEKHDKGLVALAEDIGKVLKNRTIADVYKESALIDYLAFAQEEMDLDYEDGQVQAEFEDLMEQIFHLVTFYDHATKMRLRAIHLELPNILVIEYGQPEDKPYASCPVVHVRRRTYRRAAP